MKKSLLFSLTLLFALAMKAQNTQDNKDVIKLPETVFDFGKIPMGRPATHIFEVVNTGTEPIKLDNVQASCGCTTPQWSKDPIPAGGSAKITVGYNAYGDGHFEKTVTIFYNGNQTKAVVIKGTVYKMPATSAPENSSITLLKQLN